MVHLVLPSSLLQVGKLFGYYSIIICYYLLIIWYALKKLTAESIASELHLTKIYFQPINFVQCTTWMKCAWISKNKAATILIGAAWFEKFNTWNKKYYIAAK